MSPTLEVTTIPSLDARHWPSLTSRILEAVGTSQTALIACARLTGGVLSLGRYQDARHTLTERALQSRPIRRIGGGRAIALGEGVIALAIAVPDNRWLSDDADSELPASKTLNRGVRGILEGLARMGITASYFGRDFITVDSSQAGLLSFDIDNNGTTLVECFLAAEAHWWPPDGLLASPLPDFARGFPPPASIERLDARTAEEVANAVADGFADRFGWARRDVSSPLAIEETTADDGDPSPLHPPPDLPGESDPRDIPLGFLRAAVGLKGGRIDDLRISGEFLGDSAGLDEVRRTMRGVEPTFEAIGNVLDAVYSNRAHTLLGVPDLAVVAEAIVEAASRCKEDR